MDDRLFIVREFATEGLQVLTIYLKHTSWRKPLPAQLWIGWLRLRADVGIQLIQEAIRMSRNHADVPAR